MNRVKRRCGWCTIGSWKRSAKCPLSKKDAAMGHEGDGADTDIENGSDLDDESDVSFSDEDTWLPIVGPQLRMWERDNLSDSKALAPIDQNDDDYDGNYVEMTQEALPGDIDSEMKSMDTRDKQVRRIGRRRVELQNAIEEGVFCSLEMEQLAQSFFRCRGNLPSPRALQVSA